MQALWIGKELAETAGGIISSLEHRHDLYCNPERIANHDKECKALWDKPPEQRPPTPDLNAQEEEFQTTGPLESKQPTLNEDATPIKHEHIEPIKHEHIEPIKHSSRDIVNSEFRITMQIWAVIAIAVITYSLF